METQRGCPAQSASDSETLDWDDEEPSSDKLSLRKVSMFAIVTHDVTCLTDMHSGGLAYTVFPPIQGLCRYVCEDLQGYNHQGPQQR